MAVQMLVWPLSFLSNTFAAPATMPGWLGTIAEWNPLSATVSATRELFGNPGVTGGSWVVEHPVLMAAGLVAAADRGVLPALGGPLPAARPLIARAGRPDGAGRRRQPNRTCGASVPTTGARSHVTSRKSGSSPGCAGRRGGIGRRRPRRVT